MKQHGGQHAKHQGWQRVSIARSISQDVLPAVAPSSLRDSAQSSARFGRAAEIFRSEGVTRALHKSVNCSLKSNRASSDKRRQIRCRYLSHFAARFRTAFFPNGLVRGWCLGANAGGYRQDTREKFACNGCSGMFPSTCGQRIGLASCARIRASIVCRRAAYQDIPRPASLCGPS